jgi:hypothetical protein
MPKAIIIRVIAAATVLVALSAGPAQCADPVPQSEEPPPSTVDKGHAGTSERVRLLGAWVDRFFAAENYEAEINKSWLRIRLDSFSELYEGTDVDARARLHLKLPALNKRLRFEILSPGEPDDLEGTGSKSTGSQPPGAAEEKTSAAVSYIFRALKERSIIARLGLNFDGYTPNPYAGVRYRELLPLNDDWNFRFTQRVRFYTLDQEDPDYFYSLGFALFRPLDEKSAVEYQVINDFKTDPHRLDRITVRLRHRQKIWRDWLTFEVAPQVSFPDERDFEPVPGILFRLEATFGG